MNEELICPVDSSKEIVGIDVQGRYDGVLIWRCEKCGHLWPRFAEGRLYDAAKEVISNWSVAR